MGESVRFYNETVGKYTEVSTSNPLPTAGGGGGGGTDITTLAKETKQDTGNTSLAAIATNTGAGATSALQTAGNASLATLAGRGTNTAPTYNKGATSIQSGTITAVNGTALAAFDALDYQSVTVQISGTFVGTFVLEVSNNTVDWATKVLTQGVGTPLSTATNPNIYSGDIGARYFRVRASAFTSGTMVISAIYSALSIASPTQATQPVSGSVTVSAGTVTSNPGLPTPYSLVTAATTNAAVIKATAGSLFELTISNVTAATIYVKLYNKATAPTVGTDVPIVTIPVAAGVYFPATFAALGKRFAAGIGIAVTAAAAATDTTVVTAGAQISGSYV